MLSIKALQNRLFCVLKEPVLHGKTHLSTTQNPPFCIAKKWVLFPISHRKTISHKFCSVQKGSFWFPIDHRRTRVLKFSILLSFLLFKPFGLAAYQLCIVKIVYLHRFFHFGKRLRCRLTGSFRTFLQYIIYLWNILFELVATFPDGFQHLV